MSLSRSGVRKVLKCWGEASAGRGFPEKGGEFLDFQGSMCSPPHAWDMLTTCWQADEEQSAQRLLGEFQAPSWIPVQTGF